jgi:hypothetical protein
MSSPETRAVRGRGLVGRGDARWNLSCELWLIVLLASMTVNAAPST